MVKKRPLIIDCDPGIDDAQCIMMLQGCGQFDILGITPVHGNVPLAKTEKNALYLNRKFEIGAQVVPGAENALIVRYPRAEYAHGNTGLGNLEVNVEGLSFAPGHAWDFIWDQANRYPGELEIVAVGPLTNIAITVLKHPDIVQFVKQVVVMGGAATTGNVTPYAEFNIWQDPHAANIVLNAGFDLTLVDLDCCYTAYLDKEDQKTVLETVKSTSIADLIEGFARFEEENLAALARSDELLEQFSNRYVMCDPTAAAICIDPSIAETVDKHVIVDVDGKLTIGQTVVDWFGFTGRPNVHLARRVDRKRFVELYLNCLRSYRREEL